jgi:hypothetical protein
MVVEFVEDLPYRVQSHSGFVRKHFVGGFTLLLEDVNDRYRIVATKQTGDLHQLFIQDCHVRALKRDEYLSFGGVEFNLHPDRPCERP